MSMMYYTLSCGKNSLPIESVLSDKWLVLTKEWSLVMQKIYKKKKRSFIHVSLCGMILLVQVEGFCRCIKPPFFKSMAHFQYKYIYIYMFNDKLKGSYT